MAMHAVALIHQRNQYYRRSHYRLLLLAVLCIVLNIVLLVIVVSLYNTPPKRVYFATDASGALLSEVPVNVPYLNAQQLKRYVGDALETVTSYDFLNYRTDLQNGRKYFNEEGFTKYLNALEASGNFNSVLSERFVVQGRVVGDMRIQQSALPTGRIVWRVRVPMDIVYENARLRFVQPLIADVLLGRVSIAESPSGVLIGQLFFADRRASQTKKIS